MRRGYSVPLVMLVIALAAALGVVLMLTHRPESPSTTHAGATAAPASAGPLTTDQAKEEASAFAEAYWSGRSVAPYLTPDELDTWREDKVPTPAPAAVQDVTPTVEGPSPDGMGVWVVGLLVGRPQAMEVFVTQVGGRALVDKANL